MTFANEFTVETFTAYLAQMYRDGLADGTLPLLLVGVALWGVAALVARLHDGPRDRAPRKRGPKV